MSGVSRRDRRGIQPTVRHLCQPPPEVRGRSRPIGATPFRLNRATAVDFSAKSSHRKELPLSDGLPVTTAQHMLNSLQGGTMKRIAGFTTALTLVAAVSYGQDVSYNFDQQADFTK